MSLKEAYDAAQAQLPGCRLSFATFERLATSLRVSSDDLVTRGPDLCLAWSAGLGDPWALRFIEREVFSHVQRRLQARRIAPVTVDDVLQTVRTKMFVDRPARALTYNGRSPLVHWLFVVATRTFVDHQRRERTADLTRISDGLLPSLLSTTPVSPVDDLRDQFRAALENEIRRLPPRDRSVLRLYFLEGVSVESIARMFRVHRVTVARWLWHAGDVIQNGLRETFRDQLGVASQEFDSLARRLPSRLDYDLSSALKSSGKRVTGD